MNYNKVIYKLICEYGQRSRTIKSADEAAAVVIKYYNAHIREYEHVTTAEEYAAAKRRLVASGLYTPEGVDAICADPKKQFPGLCWGGACLPVGQRALATARAVHPVLGELVADNVGRITYDPWAIAAIVANDLREGDRVTIKMLKLWCLVIMAHERRHWVQPQCIIDAMLNREADGALDTNGINIKIYSSHVEEKDADKHALKALIKYLKERRG